MKSGKKILIFILGEIVIFIVSYFGGLFVIYPLIISLMSLFQSSLNLFNLFYQFVGALVLSFGIIAIPGTIYWMRFIFKRKS